jgi:hypothetical protein
MSPMIGGATSHPHPSSPWPDTAKSRRIAGHGRGRSRPSDSARCGPVRLVASVSTSRVHPSLEVQAGVDPARSDFADRRVPVSPLHPGRGGGTRTPADAVLDTAALAAELHLFRKPPKTKKPPRSIRAACRSGACRQSFQDIDKRTSPPVKAQKSPLRGQWRQRFSADDGMCITINMGPSFYARRCAKSIEISVTDRFTVLTTLRPPPRRR